MKKSLLILAVGAVLLASLPAGANTISYSDSVAWTTTTWSSSVSIPMFNPSLGTLTSISYTLNGHVGGTAAAESHDVAPSNITLDLQAWIILKRPDLSVIVQMIPLVQNVFPATVYDGVQDFGGTSGVTYSGLSGSQSLTVAAPPPASDLTLFTGIGSIVLPVTAQGLSTAYGPGNVWSSFSTSASADVTITYNYTGVPDGGTTLILLGAALTGMASLRRRFA